MKTQTRTLYLVIIYIALTSSPLRGQYPPGGIPNLDPPVGRGLDTPPLQPMQVSQSPQSPTAPINRHLTNGGTPGLPNTPGAGSEPRYDYADEPEGWSLPRLTIPSFSMPEYELWSDSWISPTQWDGSFELGLNGTAGNAEALSIRSGASMNRTTDRHELKADMTYIKSTANGLETAHNAIFNGRDEWLLGESPWSLFWTTGVEYDEFRAFDLRLVLAAGIGYRVIDDGITKMGTRFGSGTSREFGGPDPSWVPEANFGLDYERKITEHQTFSTTMDYYPEWGNFEDYRLNTTVNWVVLLDAESNMSLKLSLIDRYDSTPNGRKPNDITYSALLLWKF